MSENIVPDDFTSEVPENSTDTTTQTDTKFVRAMLKKITSGLKRAAMFILAPIGAVFAFVTTPTGTLCEAVAKRRTESRWLTFVLGWVFYFGLAMLTKRYAGPVKAFTLLKAEPHVAKAFTAYPQMAQAANASTTFVASHKSAKFATRVGKFLVNTYVYYRVQAIFIVALSTIVKSSGKVIKLATDAVTFVFGLLSAAITLVALLLSTVLNLVGIAATFIVTLVHKIVWGVSLVLQTPSMLMQGNDCAKTDWVAYLHSWKPRNFHVSTVADVILQESRDENAIMYQVEFPTAEKADGKGRPTPKQRVIRPHFRSIIPTDFGGAAGMAATA